jgi:hypothetical protein
MDAPTLGVACAAGDVIAVDELWPIPAPLTTVACGANFSLAVEGRNALVLRLSPAAPAAPAASLVGRAARAHSTATLTELAGGGLALDIAGLADAAPPAGTRRCAADADAPPLYALVPEAAARRLTRVRAAATGAALAHRWLPPAAAAAEAAAAGGDEQQPACWPRARAAAPAPAAPRGYAVLAVELPAPSPASASTFVHNAPVVGMTPGAAFAGGALNGTVRVPAAALAQLAARGAAYPVPWTAADAAISWLAPQRLVLYIDAQRGVLPSTAALSATLDGAPLPVRPSWSCRTTRQEMCFQGWWLDLSNASIAADTDYALTLVLPPLPPGGGTAPRVGYDMRNNDLPGMPVTLPAADFNLCWAM